MIDAADDRISGDYPLEPDVAHNGHGVWRNSAKNVSIYWDSGDIWSLSNDPSIHFSQRMAYACITCAQSNATVSTSPAGSRLLGSVYGLPLAVEANLTFIKCKDAESMDVVPMEGTLPVCLCTRVCLCVPVCTVCGPVCACGCLCVRHVPNGMAQCNAGAGVDCQHSCPRIFVHARRNVNAAEGAVVAETSGAPCRSPEMGDHPRLNGRILLCQQLGRAYSPMG